MSRLLVLSRQPSVATALTSDGHDVVDLRPDVGETWRVHLAAVDGALLEIDGPLTAGAVVKGLRREGFRLPIILARNEEAGWDQLEAAGLPAVRFVRTPLFKRALVKAVRATLAAGAAPEEAPAIAPHIAVSSPIVPDEGQRAAPTLQLPATGPATKLAGRPERRPAAAVKQQPVSPTLPPIATPNGGKRRQRPARATTAAGGGPAEPPRGSPEELVARLVLLTEDLVGMAETVNVVLAEAMERMAADAGCILAPDDESWRVVAATGLRDGERRLKVDEKHWLIRELIGAHHAIVVLDSDVVRSRMANAPLAHWPHLIAVPIGETQCLILLGRRGVPFGEADVGELAAVAEEATPLITAALDVQRLARALADYCD